MPTIGATIGGKFRLERLIGEGGMGAVYEATHVVTGKRVALKWLTTPGTSSEAVQRFLREAQAAARVDHPNVVDVYDIGTEGDGHFLVMELLRGEALSDLIARGPIPHDRVVRMLVPAVRALAAAHRQAVVHRDLKPDNIFLCYTDDDVFIGPKLLDFGISKITDDFAPSLTASGTTMGTPYYMSPEQIRHQNTSDPRTDIYSFGVILYETLTGRVPFEGESYGAIAIEVATGAVIPPSRIRPSIPKELDAIVLKAMARKPDDRYASAAELATALAAFVGMPVTQTGPATDSSAFTPSAAGPRPVSGPAPVAGPPLAMAAGAAPGFGPPRAVTPGDLPAMSPSQGPARVDSGAYASAHPPSAPRLPVSPQALAGFGTGPQPEAEFRLPSFGAAPAGAGSEPTFGGSGPQTPSFSGGLAFGANAQDSAVPAFASRFSDPLPEQGESLSDTGRRGERRPVRHAPPPSGAKDRTLPVVIGVAAFVVVAAIGTVAYIMSSADGPTRVTPPVVPPIAVPTPAPVPPAAIEPPPAPMEAIEVEQAAAVVEPPPVEEPPPPAAVAAPERQRPPSAMNAGSVMRTPTQMGPQSGRLSADDF